VGPKRTASGGFTERRYTPLDVLELQVLGDLRRRGFSVPTLRRLLTALRDVFHVRLYETIGDDGPLTLLIAGDQLWVRSDDGRVFNVEAPGQALLLGAEALPLRRVVARERRRRTSGSERLARGRRRAAE
jgi:hypothetical protein